VKQPTELAGLVDERQAAVAGRQSAGDRLALTFFQRDRRLIQQPQIAANHAERRAQLVRQMREQARGVVCGAGWTGAHCHHRLHGNHAWRACVLPIRAAREIIVRTEMAFAADSDPGSRESPLVTCVVPVRDDFGPLERLLSALHQRPEVEVVVAFAGDRARAVDRLARQRPDVVWIESAPGRGPQLNAGAGRARGGWLWFLHADTVPREGWFEAFRRVDADRGVIGGSFRFLLDSAAWQARVLERLVAVRVWWFGLPYGDQGIFVRRAVFERMGGFADIPLMEDVELIGRLKRLGRLRHLREAVVTSGRRWERDGWGRRSLRNLTTLGLYYGGASPRWLATRYDRQQAGR
jgi:rSAM/selenodomain-associated transferase 2